MPAVRICGNRVAIGASRTHVVTNRSNARAEGWASSSLRWQGTRGAGGPPRSFRGGLAISRSGFKPALDELTFRSGMESQIDACIRELELIENPRPKERTWATRPP